tara:strand:- start:3290 stop:3820 length:531 start_codon:yes stop_codon:yes gene_type:complete
MRSPKYLVPAVLLLSICACGEADDGGQSDDVPSPVALLVNGGAAGGCPVFADAQGAFEQFSVALSTGDADVVDIADARIIEECSGAGGTHVFSSRTAEGKRFWLGNHACGLDLPNANLNTGVIVGLGTQTAGLQLGQEGWCMNYPGEEEIFATDIKTSAIAWFASEADAALFLNAL